MLTFKFEKLVRDKLVDLQIASGAKPKYRQLNPDEHKRELVKKVIEEAQEIFQATPNEVAAEIADVQQAIDDLKEQYGLTDADIRKAQAAKNATNGGFKQGLFVEYVEVDEDDTWVAYYRRNADRYPEIIMPAPPRTVIVNDQDEIIGHKDRGTLAKEDIYRVSALWITNSKGDILLAQRRLGKRHDPGKWGPAVAGTIDEGETYASNIIKEAEEEIGLKGIKPVEGPKRRISDRYNYFCQWYTLVIDKPASDFSIQEDEVEQVKWFTRAELGRELAEHPQDYLPGFEWVYATLAT